MFHPRMRIFGWAADTQGCGYYRMALPLAHLAARGHDVAINEVMPDEWRDTADVIVGQRVCVPGATQRWQELAREGRARLIYEVDDDLWHVDQSSRAAYEFFSDPVIRANLTANVAFADLVTTTTEPLAERLREINPNVVVLPNRVPGWLLKIPSPCLDHTGDTVTVGWGGTATHGMDWAAPARHIAGFIRREQTTRMHIMGWVPPDLWDLLPQWRRKVTGWIDSVEAMYRAIDYQIGLAPLRPHTFNRAKSPIKALEYAALGIPFVASDYGPYAGFVRHGETGYLVDRPNRWGRYLSALMDPELRRDMGAKARAVAAEHTIERNVHLWEAALCQI